MPSLEISPTRALLAGAGAAILASVAQADVTIEERMSISGAGLMKMANMNGITITRISGERARTESNRRRAAMSQHAADAGLGQPSLADERH